MGGNNDGGTFDGYQINTVNPGNNLLIFTGAACLLCFFLGFLTIPGKILHPFSKRLKEFIAFLRDAFAREKQVDHDQSGGINNINEATSYKALTHEAKAEVMAKVKAENPWREVFDERTGKPYYYHNETKKTTWRKPLSLYKSRIKAKAKKTFKKQLKNRGMEMEKPNENVKKPVINERVEVLLEMSTCHENSDADKDKNQASNNPHNRLDQRSASEANINMGEYRLIESNLGKDKTRKRWTSNRRDGGSGRLTKFSEFFGMMRRTNSDPIITTRQHPSSNDRQEPIEKFDDNPKQRFTASMHYLPMWDEEAAAVAAASDSDESTVETINVPPDSPERLRKETRKVWGLGIPWMVQSIISDGASIMQIMLISHFMGLRDMLVYSNVWFIIYLAFVLNDAWDAALYKHVNVSAALETDDGYRAAGKYLKIGVIGNLLLSVPLSILAIIYIPMILLWFGYDENVAEISRVYTVVAVINNIFDTSTGIIDTVLDIDGHAKWCAKYNFWDALISTIASFFFIAYAKPSLFWLGIFHFGCDIVSSIIYFAITVKYYGWYDRYIEGLTTRTTELHGAQIYKVAKMSIPMLIESIIANIEDTVFTIFAASQGSAEAATWILLSYVWSAVGIAPECFSAAASTRVTRLIGKGEIQVAKRVSHSSMYLSTLIAIVCSVLMYFFRKQFVWCFSLDETLEQMLLEIIPYISICYPFMMVGGTAMELNDALHLFKRAMFSMAIVTIVIMVPLGYAFTYFFNYNIEGLACAQCIGYTAAGVINIVFFVNANWEKAVTKAHGIAEAGMMKSEKKQKGGSVGGDGNAYDEYDWDELPEEVKLAAQQIGYDKQKWDNDEDIEYEDYDWQELTEKQRAAAVRLGYSEGSWNGED